jgi:hypothetical protein
LRREALWSAASDRRFLELPVWIDEFEKAAITRRTPKLELEDSSAGLRYS